ncbi:type II secretion system F family protein [Microbacterium sp. GXF7504]
MTGADAVTHLALGVLLGGAFGLGVCLILSALPRWRAVTLDRRIAPYLRDVADPLGLTPLSRPEPWRAWVPALVARFGDGAALEQRLRRAGRTTDAAAFRIRQLVWALAGLLLGAVLAVAVALAGTVTPPVVVLPLVVAVAAGAVPEVLLRRAVAARAQRVTEELPTILEFLALCLAAGEGVFDAVRRVAAIGQGELVSLLQRAVVAVGTGSTLADALREVARDAHVPAVARSIDQIVAAMERGAPLAQVLQAQAQDAQEEAKRVLIEQAGRKEIAMLFPLVFLILPLSVLIAIFPGVLMLRLGW